MTEPEPIGLTAEQSWQMIQDDPRAVLVDIRSSMEYLFVGHPKGAVHVPWIDEPDWVENPDFVTDIRKLLLGGAVCVVDEGCAPVILICRTGNRTSTLARHLVEQMGYTQVFNVRNGISQWIRDDRPVKRL